jgi:hypothetical protein
MLEFIGSHDFIVILQVAREREEMDKKRAWLTLKTD